MENCSYVSVVNLLDSVVNIQSGAEVAINLVRSVSRSSLLFGEVLNVFQWTTGQIDDFFLLLLISLSWCIVCLFHI